jgi:Zn-dependent protease with chaperone function
MEHLLHANLLHGAVALTWALGVRRLAGPLSPTLWADLLRWCLGLPPLMALLRLLGLPGPPDGLHTVRVARWSEALAAADPMWHAMLWLLLGGTAGLFLLQEALPAWQLRRGRARAEIRRDAELTHEVQALLERMRLAGVAPFRGRTPKASRMDSADLSAGLIGILEPQVVASNGLLASLDNAEREATLAHELAHWARGGNLRVLGVWLLRALQALNPASLLLFRALIEAEEAACDEVAARVTGRPAVLASALIKAHGHPDSLVTDHALERARGEILRRAELASTRSRVEQLLSGVAQVHPSTGATAAMGLGLAFLLWSIS